MNRAPKSRTVETSEVALALRACNLYFLTAFGFSFVYNVLFLTPTLYVLQVSDRVLTSGSHETLFVLTAACLIALTTLVAIDAVRARILIRCGLRFDSLLSTRVVVAMIENSSAFRGQTRRDALRNLDMLRQFLTAQGIHALFDLPWAPLYLIVIFMIHPWLGLVAVVFSVLLVALTVATEVATNGPLTQAAEAGQRHYTLTQASQRNAEVILSMGMLDGLLARWRRDRNAMLSLQAEASDRASYLSGGSKFLRLAVQALILGVGALLVIDRKITGGEMFAAMILIGRGTQPIDQIVGVWKSLITARAAYQSLKELLIDSPLPPPSTALPKPRGFLSVEQLAFVPPGAQKPVLIGVNFQVEPGNAIAIIGPSAAGKSTLARLLVGLYKPSAGAVRLDGANMHTWDRNELGHHIGYLPQDIELFNGTVAENIARFTPAPDKAIIEAAMMAGAHEMILRLPQGYDTAIGEDGALISGGQRQRIGLARALFGDPCLIVLDEPNSNLDSDGEIALAHCILSLKESGKTVVMVTHRPSSLNTVENVLYLHSGQVMGLVPRHQLLAKIAAAPQPMKPVRHA